MKTKEIYWKKRLHDFEVWERGDRENALSIYARAGELVFEGHKVAERWDFPEAYKNARKMLEEKNIPLL